MLDWKDIDTVLLDMDGTLLDLHFDNYFWLIHLPKRYAEIHALPEEHARNQLTEHYQRIKGTLDWYCLDFWGNELNLDIPALKLEIQHLIGYRPHVQNFLQSLKLAKQRVVLVTNAHRQSLQIKLSLTDLDKWMDKIVSSHDYRYPKEDQKFWEKLQKEEPFNPDRTLLIDDSLAVLRSAKEYGIAHLITISQPDSRQPVREIEEFPSLSEFNQIAPSRSSA